MENNEGRGERIIVSASEISNKIVLGEPIELDGVIIRGDLYLNKLKLSEEKNGIKIVISKITIRNSEIDGKIDFSETVFREGIDIINSRFEDDILSENAYFQKHVTFFASQFGKNVNFAGSRFDNEANFGKARFKGEAIFKANQFMHVAYFWKSEFNNHADFSKSQFRDNTYFSESRFKGYADFRESQIIGDIFFRRSVLQNDAYFIRSAFGGVTSFGESRFDGDADFSESQFEDTDFWNTNFEGDVLFIQTHFHDSLNLKRSRFRGILTFKGSKFEDLRAEENAFRLAKNILEKNGDREEADYHYYREMAARRKQKSLIIRYSEYILVQLIFGYGIKPFRLFVSWLLIVYIFALFYWVGQGVQNAESMLDYIYFSLLTSTLGETSMFRPDSEFFAALAVLERTMGILLLVALIATIVRRYMR